MNGIINDAQIERLGQKNNKVIHKRENKLDEIGKEFE
jgi:hypothetical protein